MKKTMITAALLLLGTLGFAQNGIEDLEIDNSIYKNDIVQVDGFSNFQFGFSKFVPGEDDLEMRLGKSFAFSMDMVSLKVKLDKNDRFSLLSGLRWTFENYRPKEAIYYADVDSDIFPFPTANADKTKMRADYLGIPVGFAFETGEFRIYADVIGEVLTNSISKVKYEDKTKDKEKLSGFEDLRAGVEGGVSYGPIGAFVRYTLTPSFKHYKAIKTDDNVITVGLTLSL